MLDKTSRKVLNFVVYKNPDEKDGLFTWDYVSKQFGLSKEEMFDCVRFLEGEGLLRCVWTDIGGIKMLHGFAPNHKGRHYREFERIKFFLTILNSVLLPIIVSIITALIVTA